MRLIGRDMAVFKVDDVGPTADYISTLKSCEINFRMDMQENGALNDGFHYNQNIRQDWTISFSLQVTDAALPELYTLLQNGTTVLVSGNTGVYNNGSPPVTNGRGFTATGVLSTNRISVSTGSAQEETFEIVPRGALTFS